MNRTLYILHITLLLFVGGVSLSYAQDRPKVQIFGNVYGGGELAQVVTPESSLNDVLVTDDKLNDGPSGLFNPQAHHQYTTYVHLGSDAEVYGRSFGGGKGDNDAAGETLGRVIGQTDIVLDGATVWSELYGGGQMADVRGNALLHFKKGKAGHNAFGGGLGVLTENKENEKVLPDNRQTVLASADVRYIGTVTDGVMDDVMRTDIAPTGNTFVVFDGSEDSYTHYEYMEERTIHYDGEGNVAKNSEGNYFDDYKQYDEESPGQYFSINHNIYGGGMTASNIEGNTYVHIRYGMVSKDMLEWIGYGHGIEPAWSKVFRSIANAQFCVFGGGYGYHSEIKNDTYVTMDVAGDGTYKYIEEFTQWFATTGKEKYHWDTNTGTPENIYKAADEATWSHGAPGRSAMDIVGGGYNGKVLGTTHVETSGDLVVRKVYGGGYYASVGNTEVNLMSGIYERVYGGGMIGNVYGTATLNFGQQGLTDDVHDNNLHLLVKDAVYGGNDVSGTVGTTEPGSKTNTHGSVTYNVYDPVDDASHGVRLNIYGGLVLGDVYGAGNGNHPGYGNPDYVEFNLSQHPSENYRQLTHTGTKGTALVYKYRPRTGRVVMNIQGNDGVDFNDDPQIDKVRIWGRTFGGGNSCNVGIWNGTEDDKPEVYADDATSWHPGDNFTGDGTIAINIGSHVQLGNRNDSHETPNGLFMGCNGEHMITQHTDKEKARYYHQYWDSKAECYYPGFVVYEDDAKTPIKRTVGLKAFRAFINNILTKSDNVSLKVKNLDDKTEAEDVWMSNFVGGGYRGSMQAATEDGKFDYTLPTGVTIGHSVVGGAFNAHIIYRVYATNYGDGTYRTDSYGNYIYETVEPAQGVLSKAEAEAYDIEHGLTPGTTPYDYIKKLYAEGHEGDEAYKTGYLRYNFDGGMLDHTSTGITGSTSARVHQVGPSPTDFITPSTGYNANKDKALVMLKLYNRLDPIINDKGTPQENIHGGIVYGGCFYSGFVEGDTWVDYRCSLAPGVEDVLDANGKGKYFDKTNPDVYLHANDIATHNALMVFGAGYGADTRTDGDAYLRILHNGSSTDDNLYPLVYNAFGGGNMGTVTGSARVFYNGGLRGTLLGSVYGGGFKGKIDGGTYLELAGGLVINAYGGSRQADIGGAAHVWAYDGNKFPSGEDVKEPENAPLLIGNLYGGNDISGGINGTLNPKYADTFNSKNLNTYVQIGSSKVDDTRGFPLVGNLFAGGNGAETVNPADAPNVANSLLHVTGGTTLRAFGGGNKATITADANIFVNATVDKFTEHTFTLYQKEVLMKTVFKGVLNGYHWDETTLVMDPYHVVKMYGGNNVATMAIQPNWNLKDGLLENVYSGGNMGDMTYYNAEGKAATKDGLTTTKTIGIENSDGTNANYTPRGLSITINSPLINIKNLFGGCRLSNVVPGGYAIDPETDEYVIDPETHKQVLAQNDAFADCEDLYGATINILQGNIENVYGGNDVGGKVYFGTNINISGGILGNVYGSGNGDYLYRFDPEAKDVTERIHDELGFYYDVPEKMGETLIETAGTVGSDTHKILTINRIRPAVDNTFINIGGLDAAHNSGTNRVAAVKGNIFMGGNATTITRDGNFTFAKFKLGSYTTINGLFLGSDGHSYCQNDNIENFAKLNGISDMGADTDFNDGHELDKQHNPILLNTYLMAVDMQSPPKDFSIKAPLTEAYLGTFCGGGNRGSMLHDKTVEIDFPADLIIYDKIVGGCMDATVSYNQGGTIIKSEGGYTRALTNDDPNDNTKIRYNINSQFKPLVMDAEFDKNTGKNKHNETLSTAMAKGFVYDNLNAGGNAWLTGCNIYGGCYERGIVVGDVELNLTSSLLGHMANDGESIFKSSVSDGIDDGVTNKSARTKFDNALANGAIIGNIYGAGFGQESDVQGDVHINITAPGVSTPGNPVHPSANNVYGGGRSGQLHGNSYIRVTDGHVFGDVVGGCDAATMYGSTYIGIGYPTYYKCNTTGAYNLARGDKWNGDNIKQTVYYKAGDFIAPNVWSQMSTTDQAKFAPQNEMTGVTSDIWNKTDIIVRGGVYGGGFTVASSTTGMAGNYTVLKELDENGDKTNYGGNSTILVADQGSYGNGDHIRISTLQTKPVTFTQAQIDTGATTLGLFTLAGKKFTHLSDGTPTAGTTYYDLSGDGGIYGDGHLTFCEGFRAADISGYGYNTGTVKYPRLMNTFQRLDLLDVKDCCLMLQGAQDFATDKIDATIYSMTRIDELRMNSSIDANANLGQISAPTGSGEGANINTAKQRNYLGFFKNVHYLGAIVTNDEFASATFHEANGSIGSRTYRAEKENYITTYNSNKDVDAFKPRNVGTARNCIGINNGYCLRVQNLGKNGTTYYGPIVGVAEVKLLTLTQGEGGGYVYADNIHADTYEKGNPKTATFMNESGNFVFPGVVDQGVDAGGNPIADQYIVDDCFTKHFGTPDAITTKNGDLDEAHYWYVEGNKYFYNTTLTGYTYQDSQTFNLTDTDPNVVLSGLTNGSTLNVKKVEWLSTHRGGYDPVLSNATEGKVDDYEFDLDVNGTSAWTADMPRYTKGMNPEPLTTDKILNSSETPIFNVKLQDKLDNSGDTKYNNHLDEPELVKIYLEGSTKDANSVVHNYEYTITLNIIYLQGPTYTGGVTIENCALPGEMIGFSSKGITIKTPDLMPVTSTSWKILPFKEIDHGEWKWDSERGTVIDKNQYSHDLEGNLTGTITARYDLNEDNIAYIFTAGGHDFPVLPSKTNEKKEQRMIVVHNYHRMKDIEVHGLEASVVTGPGARVYIYNVEDLNALVGWVNANKRTIDVDFVLQNDITLNAKLTDFTQNFGGRLHGNGYHIDLGNHQESLFGPHLTGMVYNLGIIGGTIATTGTLTNCYELKNANDLQDPNVLYGKNAYDLSHHFTPTKEGDNTLAQTSDGYVYKYYANGDYQYATTDRVWSLRTAEPNYGRTETHHVTAHTHDAARWQDIAPSDTDNPDILAHTGYNAPLYDGTLPVADRMVPIGVGAEYITYHGLPVGYANDYLFFGQHLDKTNADAYPVHIDGKVNDGNRVFEVAGYYQDATDKKFHYNKDAWALRTTLTAIDFTDATAEGDNAATVPTHFSVDSNHDYATDPYSNATTGHITQNLLVYNDGAPAFDKRDVEDIAEKDVVYHNIVKDGGGNYATNFLHLVDKQDFWCPKPFDVTQRAWYERKPEVYHNKPTDGWDAVCLPFTIHKVSAQRGISDVLSHFYGGTTKEGASEVSDAAVPRGNTGHEYWLRGLIAVDGDKATFARPSVTNEAGVFYRSDFDHDSYEYPGNGYLNILYNDADCEYDADEEHAFNVHNIYSHPRTFTDYPYLTHGIPYIVAFPGERYHEFDLSGHWTADISSSATVNNVPQTITYESEEGITVPVSELKEVTAGGYTHRGAFINADGSVYDLEESASHDGSSFGTATAMLPFRSYLMATVSSARPMYIYISGDNDDDQQGREEEMLNEKKHKLVAYSVNGNIIIESTYDTQLTIHTAAGQTVRAIAVQEGSNLYTGFAPGIYIINGRKLYVNK